MVPPIPIEALWKKGTAVHDFKGPYLTQNYDLPRQYAYQWVFLELLYPAAVFISRNLLFSLDALLVLVN